MGSIRVYVLLVQLPPSPPALSLLGPQSRFGGKLLENGVLCPQNETAVLNFMAA